MKTRILVVEDNPDDQELLRNLLEKAGLSDTVDLVSNGEDALTYLADHEAELHRLVAIFLDLNLPTMSGIKLLEGIRQMDRLRYLPVAVMTSSNSPADLTQCRKLGVTCYVAKPIRLSSFSAAIAGTFHPLDDTGKLPRSIKA